MTGKINEERRMVMKALAIGGIAAGIGSYANLAAAGSKSKAPSSMRTTKSSADEYIPGMRKQGKGIKMYCESDFAPMKACIVGNTSAVYLPDPDTPEMQNLLKGSTDKAFVNYLRKHAGKHLKDTDPEVFELIEMESNALAAAFRKHGVKVIRNETGAVPDELVNWHTGWGGAKFLSVFGQSVGEVIGNCFVNLWEVTPSRGMEFQHRDALLEIFENDPNAVWLSMPPAYPTSVHPTPRPFLSPGDPRIFPNKLCVLGIGVAERSHVEDRTKPRSSGDELGAEFLRRMLEPFGWRVEVVYFNSKYTYHIDALMALVGEGVIGLPKGDEPALWTPLPKELKDWEIIDIDPKEQKMGVCNSEVIDNKYVVIVEGANKMAEAISKRGFEPVLVPYRTIYDTFGSGIHCSVMGVWREG